MVSSPAFVDLSWCCFESSVTAVCGGGACFVIVRVRRICDETRLLARLESGKYSDEEVDIYSLRR